MPEANTLDALLTRGLILFNHGAYWHAHEAWEDAWHQCPTHERTFWQGLIMVAAALYKLEQPRGRPHAMRRLLAKANVRLQPWSPSHRRINVRALCQDISTLDREASRWLDHEHGWQSAFQHPKVVLDRPTEPSLNPSPTAEGGSHHSVSRSPDPSSTTRQWPLTARKEEEDDLDETSTLDPRQTLAQNKDPSK